MNRAAVLVITHWFDPTADYVVEQLNHRNIQVMRLDVADFPWQLIVTGKLEGNGGWRTTLRLGTRLVMLEDLCGVYFRRPTAFAYDHLEAAEKDWSVAEARAGLGGLLMTCDRWLNHPRRAVCASYKPVQLAVAAAAGLTVPATLITNDPAQARRFAATVGEVIYKPLAQARAGQGRMIYATAVTAADLADDRAAGIASTAHQFQQRIRHDHAVRLNVIDDHMFATAIHAHSEAAAVDWRADYAALTYAPLTIPEDVRRAVTALMATLGLRFGAFDFLVTPDGRWVFLEVNPNGQWAWIEQETGVPIASAIADALTRDRT